MQDFPSNSQRARARPETEPKKVERVVTSGEAVQRKRGLGRQFKDTFIGGSAKMAVEYMVTDVVVPAIRDTLHDALRGGLDKLIYGDNRRSRGGYVPPSFANGHVDYQSKSSSYTTRRPEPQRMLSQRSRSRGDFREIEIPTRAEAEEVLERMYDILSRYGTVTVADLYEMTGIRGAHTDNKWGWEALRGARVERLSNGRYLLDLPEPEAL